MEVSETILQQLQADLNKYEPMLVHASQAIIEQNVSNYPIFIVHKYQANIGIALLDRNQSGTHWSINASTLEEFVTKRIINDSKSENFKAIYKNPREYFCIFILDLDIRQFVFSPIHRKSLN